MRVLKRILRSIIEYPLSIIGFKLARNIQHLSYRTSSNEITSLIQRLKPVGIVTPLIRLGPNGDGGYLIPDDLVGVSSCFSPGVSAISGFELDCANRGMTVYLADKSVERPVEKHKRFHFTKKYIGSYLSEDFLTIDHWLEKSSTPPEQDSLLQMDIEGFEYESILSLSDHAQSKFRIIVIEFHSLEQLWNKPFFDIVSRAFEKILQTHVCVHIHPNNYSPSIEHNGITIPPLLEMTFLRKDRVIRSEKALSFPHDLDCDNTEHVTIVLPEIWYK